jgi:catechol 2,3-dioxygenase-like lactoylglutathione lyase family enzyme
VIPAVHTILYADDAPAARAFFRDVIGFDAVDSGGGWLIFGLPPGELACHPAEGAGAGRAELYLMCIDIEATRSELERRGVHFTAPVSDQGWGRLTHLAVPGFGELGLYQPRHASPLDAFASPHGGV